MDDTLDKISNLYSGKLSEHGDQSKAVGWPTADSQELRFEKLTQVIPEMNNPFSVNDYGCGYGAHLDYLLQEKYSVSGYNGYDLSEEMLNKSKERLKGFKGNLNLINSSKISTPADFTFVSGTFNVRFESTYDEWKKFIEGTLIMINKSSKLGFSFNLLSKYVDWEEPHLFYGDPYPLFEWTILVRK
jgi:SAM-dependent methyltransferase